MSPGGGSGGALLQIEDLGSTNGSYVNEQRLQGTRYLQPEDMIRVGDTVFIVRAS